MKVLLVSSNFPPEIGGPAASVEYISKRLIWNGIENTIITNGTDLPHKDPSNVIRTPVVTQKKHSLTGSFLRMYHLFSKILSIGKNYDLFHSQDVNVSGFPTMLAAMLLRKPYIVKFSGDLYTEFQLRKGEDVKYALESENIVKRFFNFAQKVICNNSSAVIATSGYVKNYLLSIGVKWEKIKLIPNGVEKQKIDGKIVRRIRERYGKNAVCTSCRVTKIKGIGTLIEAAKLLPEYNFVVFGDGKDMDYFRQVLKDENVKNFQFYGKVSHEKIQSYIKACKIFVLASYYEPFGIAVLDAMVANIPVIVSDSGGMKETVKNNAGLIFKTGSAEDLADKIRKAGKVDLKRQKEALKKYYWENIVKEYIKEYNRVSDGKK